MRIENVENQLNKTKRIDIAALSDSNIKPYKILIELHLDKKWVSNISNTCLAEKQNNLIFPDANVISALFSAAQEKSRITLNFIV